MNYRFLNDRSLDNIAAHKYQPGVYTFLDDFLNFIWWTPAARLCPPTLAPNLITLVAFLCTFAAFAAVGCQSPTFERPIANRWRHFAALMMFCHQTLDAIDGKHARATGTSSPLGQLFDHGCDALSVTFVAFSVLGAVRLGLGWGAFVLLFCLQSQLFLYTWWELQFGVFRSATSRLTGVTEGQLVVILCFLVPTMFHDGDQVLLSLVGSLEVSSIILGVTTSVLTAMILSDTFFGAIACDAIGRYQLIGLFCHLGLQVGLWTSGLISQHPLLVAALLTSTTGAVAIRMSLAAMCKITPRAVLHLPLIPFYCFCSFLVMFGTNNFVAFPALVLIAGWNVLYLVCLVGTSVSSICARLGVPLLAMPKTKNV